ncbi:hypothetical protein J6590_047495, partial [Homalodisca vitripennis]
MSSWPHISSREARKSGESQEETWYLGISTRSDNGFLYVRIETWSRPRRPPALVIARSGVDTGRYCAGRSFSPTQVIYPSVPSRHRDSTQRGS